MGHRVTGIGPMDANGQGTSRSKTKSVFVCNAAVLAIFRAAHLCSAHSSSDCLCSPFSSRYFPKVCVDRSGVAHRFHRVLSTLPWSRAAKLLPGEPIELRYI